MGQWRRPKNNIQQRGFAGGHSYVDYFYAPIYSKIQINYPGIYELVTLLSDPLFQPWLRQKRPSQRKIFSKVCTFNKCDQQHYIKQDSANLLTFQIALAYLDEEIGKSKNLRKAVPLKLVAVGGFVAVSYFHNRASTEDLDCMIDPGLKSLTKLKGKLARAIKAVAHRKDYDEGWVNDNVRMFAVGDSVQPLFRESVEQNVVLWRGKNLVIYAVNGNGHWHAN